MPVGFTKVVANYLQLADGTPIDNATICFTPINSATRQPISFRAGGNEGPVSFLTVRAPVSGGAFSIELADTALTYPIHLGYAVTLYDNLTGSSLLGPGYECIQPTGTAWSLDTYEPNLGTLVTIQQGPQGEPGIPGGVAGTMFDCTPPGAVDGTIATFMLPGSPAILFLTRNGVRQMLGTDYTIVGSTVTFAPTSVPQPNDILWATGVTPTDTGSASNTVLNQIQLLDQVDNQVYTYVSRYGQLDRL